MASQNKLKELSDEYENLQTELSASVQIRQKLEAQFNENKSVQKEFSKLGDDANIYKLVGPVLLKQETAEARSTVDSRLEYIEKEIKRTETSIQDIESKCEDKKMEIIRIQSQIRQTST